MMAPYKKSTVKGRVTCDDCRRGEPLRNGPCKANWVIKDEGRTWFQCATHACMFGTPGWARRAA